ncbi:hypothetical protein J6590_018020 [Homalodisca vitripennis]|nr:hypothetical protein J6590_018020 [Homalodisca vitripennis]
MQPHLPTATCIQLGMSQDEVVLYSTDTAARKYNNVTHQLNGWRDSAVTLFTRLFDFDLSLRMGKGLR